MNGRDFLNLVVDKGMCDFGGHLQISFHLFNPDATFKEQVWQPIDIDGKKTYKEAIKEALEQINDDERFGDNVHFYFGGTYHISFVSERGKNGKFKIPSVTIRRIY